MTFDRFLLRRATFALLLIIGISSASLLLTLLAPGDFVTVSELPPDEAERKRKELGLDRPLLIQYLDGLSRVARLDFGNSLHFSRPVSELVAGRARNTAVLATAALLVATVVGIPLGIYTGMQQHGVGVGVIRAISVLLLSMPPLIASLALLMLAARTGWLPPGGMVSSDANEMSWAQWSIDVLHHVALPALALSMPLAAMLERLQSQALRRAISEPFVRAAEARGLTSRQARLRHGWRPSLGAVLGFYGLMIGSLFSGSFIVEVVTGWPGLGRLMVDALGARDLFLVTGCAAAGATFLAAGTLISDVLLAAADPRVRLGA